MMNLTDNNTSNFFQKNMTLITNIISLFFILVGYSLDKHGQWFRTIGYFALSGAVTNWLAIYMLFEKVPFLYGSGVIPARFEDFKKGIKDLILKEFFNEKNIRNFLQIGQNSDSSPFQSFADSLNYEQIYQQLLETLLQSSFGKIVSMVGGRSLFESVKDPIIQKLKDIVAETATTTLTNHPFLSYSQDGWLEEKIENIVDHRLQELSPQMVKKIMQDMIAKHLGWLVVWGGIFGGLIGAMMEAVTLITSHFTPL